MNMGNAFKSASDVFDLMDDIENYSRELGLDIAATGQVPFFGEIEHMKDEDSRLAVGLNSMPIDCIEKAKNWLENNPLKANDRGYYDNPYLMSPDHC
ncbi:MAG: hypothetical protein KTR28_02110 [Micavibrio sp.]|nr:hypothetical protein [Micavibrio sp.]